MTVIFVTFVLQMKISFFLATPQTKLHQKKKFVNLKVKEMSHKFLTYLESACTHLLIFYFIFTKNLRNFCTDLVS